MRVITFLHTYSLKLIEPGITSTFHIVLNHTCFCYTYLNIYELVTVNMLVFRISVINVLGRYSRKICNFLVQLKARLAILN